MIIERVAARELTDQIRAGADALWQLVAQAYVNRAWQALGYCSWDDYCTREFGDCRIRLPREERQEIVASLREVGMSTRAIAAATGVARGTVLKDLGEVDQIEPPDSIVGFDGKKYPSKQVEREHAGALGFPVRPEVAATNAESSTRRRRPLPEAFNAVRYDLVKRAEALARLAADDRFDRNAEQLAQRYRFDLIQARDAIQAVIDRLPTPADQSQEG
ncbi:hypothetical protein [Nocardia sp. NPDC127526]|uniref:hypothetical protein n=1 Tax=Nocardia sp. NPDC127526 TaxID=3345393 RepID=UPI003645641A